MAYIILQCFKNQILPKKILNKLPKSIKIVEKTLTNLLAPG
jgi:hypothetical protein